MANLETLATALTSSLGAITSLKGRATDYEPEKLSPPAGIVSLDPDELGGEFDAVMGGVSWWRFTVRVVCGIYSDRNAQRFLYRLLSSTGADSMKLALEADRTLGGNAHLLLVEDPKLDSTYEIGDEKYYAAICTVRVLA